MERKREISVLNCLFCIMVVCIHLLSEPVTSLTKGSWQYLCAYIPQQLFFVAVYGFIFLSGLKLFLKNRPEKLSVFYKKRFISIVVPYLAAVTVYYIVFHFVYGYGISIKNILYYYGLGRIASHMYFVVAIVQFYLLMPLWRWLLNKYGWPVPVLCSILVMILYRPILGFIFKNYFPNHQLMYIDRFFLTYIAYWLMGCAAGMNYDTFKQMLKKNFSLLLTATVVCTAFFIFFIIPRQQYLDWNVSEILRSSYMMLTILTLFAAALKVNSLRIFSSRPVLWLDKNSYTVYLYHMICLMAVNYVLDKIGITGVLKRFPLKFIFTFALTFAVCLFIEQLKRLILKNKKITPGA